MHMDSAFEITQIMVELYVEAVPIVLETHAHVCLHTAYQLIGENKSLSMRLDPGNRSTPLSYCSKC